MKKFFAKFGATFIGLLLLIAGVRAALIDIYPVSAHSFPRTIELWVLLVLVVVAVVGIVWRDLRLRVPAFIAGTIATVYLVQLVLPYDAINGANELLTRIFAIIQIVCGTFVIGTTFHRVFEALGGYEYFDEYIRNRHEEDDGEVEDEEDKETAFE